MREPTDRERGRAREIARRTMGSMPAGAASGSEVEEELATRVLDAALRTYADDTWVDAGVEPTIDLGFLLRRSRP